jgi:predicted transcriptional regulator
MRPLQVRVEYRVSVTRTIRLEKELDEALQRIAKSEKVTVNSLVNRSLTKFVDWDIHADKFGMIALRPALAIELMERQSVDEARELGRKAARDSARQAVEFLYIGVTLPNVIEFLRRFGRYGGRYDFEESREGRKHVILLRQAMGLKWSTFNEGLVRGLLEDEMGLKIEVSVSPDLCLARFDS